MVFFYFLPSKYSIRILKSKFWHKLNFQLKGNRKIILKNTLKYYSKNISKKKLFSSCLSRSTLFMIILEIFGVETNCYLGMILNKNQQKVPHAWLELKENGETLTNKIDKCSLITRI